MSKPKVTQPAAPVQPPVVETQDDLPIVEFVGLTKLPKGWVAVAGKIQGTKILETEAISEPAIKAHAYEKLRIAVVSRFRK